MSKSIPLIFMIAISCSSTSWKTLTIEHRLMDWRLCSEIDGEYDNQGFCFRTKECKGRLRKKCRVVTNFCKFADRKCYDRWSLTGKKLSSK